MKKIVWTISEVERDPSGRGSILTISKRTGSGLVKVSLREMRWLRKYYDLEDDLEIKGRVFESEFLKPEEAFKQLLQRIPGILDPNDNLHKLWGFYCAIRMDKGYLIRATSIHPYDPSGDIRISESKMKKIVQYFDMEDCNGLIRKTFEIPGSKPKAAFKTFVDQI